jgi:hypothetical protein
MGLLCEINFSYNNLKFKSKELGYRIRKNDPDQIVENQKILNIDEV